MHELMMAQSGMDHDHHGAGNENGGYGSNEGWVDINPNYNSPPQHQSPIFEHGGFAFMQQPLQHNGLPTEQPYTQQRMAMPQHPLPPSHHSAHQQLLPLIMPSNPTWPSMLTNPASYPAPPVAIPASAPPLVKGNGSKSPGTTPAPRKTLTDNDRRRMCQYHDENPSIKQTEIGGKSITKCALSRLGMPLERSQSINLAYYTISYTQLTHCSNVWC